MRPIALLGGLILPVAIFAACAAAPVGRPAGTGSADQGPLSGTYSADSTAGTAPFVAITFPDATHYQYVDKTCAQGPATGGDVGEASGLGDDPGDAVVDGNGTVADAGADNCIHTGTYTVDDTGLKLTDTGSTKVVFVPISPLDPDGTEVGFPSEDAAKAALVVGAAALFGAIAISQFSAGGTDLRRTGLVDGTGVSSGSTGSSSGSNPGSTDTDSGSLIVNQGDAGLLTDQAVALAEKWVAVKMPYCQAISGGREIDSACIKIHGATCTRTGAANNVAWNAYRSDCSGLVSYSWSLKAPGLTTRDFVPGAAKYIPMQDLKPGDALLRPGHHIVLFKDWTDKSKGQAKVISEPGCAAKGGPYAQEQNWSFNHAPGAGTNDNIAGGTYYSIRKK